MVVVLKPLVFLTYMCIFFILSWDHIIGSQHNGNYLESLQLLYPFQWVFPTEHRKKYKNINKGKYHDSEYLKSLLYWCKREFISKLWKPKNALIYQYTLCTDIFYWPVSLLFSREHHIQRMISNPFQDALYFADLSIKIFSLEWVSVHTLNVSVRLSVS